MTSPCSVAVWQMYQILGTVIYMAVSADATCRGLRSQRDGPLVMEFTKGGPSSPSGVSLCTHLYPMNTIADLYIISTV